MPLLHTVVSFRADRTLLLKETYSALAVGDKRWSEAAQGGRQER